MLETQTGKTVYRLYDSVEELLVAVDQVDQQRCEYYDPGNHGRRSFIGREFDGWEAVYRAARQPWAQGLKTLERMLGDLDGSSLPKPTCRRRRMRFSEDDGDEVDYDRLRSGQPFWRTSRRQNTRGPATITVIVDVAANYKTKHTDILWRGAAAIALTQRLEEAGYRVELWIFARSDRVWASTGKRYDRNGTIAVCLKRPGDPLDTSTLISAVSGWFFRTVLFRAWCQGEWKIRPPLGHARPPADEDLNQISRDPKRIVIAGAFSYGAAVEQARKALQNIDNPNP